MPDKPLTVITYAASASLAAIALVYFFNPNYLIDGESSASSASARKKGVVGLSNPANDCFINSVLQSLAGLGELRLYLIRELHRRNLDGPEVYATIPEGGKDGKPIDVQKLLSLQSGEVTQGLKDMIDGLNERPIYKKTISAANFIAVLEHAFGTRISKSQQDAQELLQIVAERLSEEYHAGKEARKRVTDALVNRIDSIETTPPGLGLSTNIRISEDAQSVASRPPVPELEATSTLDEEYGFPLEGQTESQIECQLCHFVPKANPVTFVMLTLTVPQRSSTSLNECFDAHFKPEYIDDYKCDKCRLKHAVTFFTKELARAHSREEKEAVEIKIAKVRKAIKDDPEKPPEGVQLPDSKFAPTRRISRHVQITTFPKVLVVHLSRSIFDPRSSSTKNAAKVSFPERLPLGGLLNRRQYKLLGLVSHKGTHNSGHYESFRRQHLYAPYSTPHTRNESGPYSTLATPNPSTIPSPYIPATPSLRGEEIVSPPTHSEAGDLLSPSILSPSPSLSSTTQSAPSTRPSSGSANGGSLHKKVPISAPPPAQLQDVIEKTLVPQNDQSSPRSSMASNSTPSIDTSRLKRKKKTSDRWWRISDDKIKECKTSDVLGMQKEVYMLFYEMEKG